MHDQCLTSQVITLVVAGARVKDDLEKSELLQTHVFSVPENARYAHIVASVLLASAAAARLFVCSFCSENTASKATKKSNFCLNCGKSPILGGSQFVMPNF